MRLSLPVVCLPLVGACTGSGMIDSGVMGDASARDAAEPRDAGLVQDSGPPDAGVADTGAGCAYPEGAVEPMALGGVLWPYRWPEAIGGDGTTVPLDLAEVPCSADENIDWSPFDVLVFISIPAW